MLAPGDLMGKLFCCKHNIARGSHSLDLLAGVKMTRPVPHSFKSIKPTCLTMSVTAKQRRSDTNLMEVGPESQLIMPVTAHGCSARYRLQALDLLECPAYEAVVAQVDDALLQDAVEGAHPGNSLHTMSSGGTPKCWQSVFQRKAEP